MRLGTIGTGNVVRQFIAAGTLGNLNLGAVYSRYQEKGEKFASEYGEEIKVYTDLEAFLSDPSIDVVYIASPNRLHYEQAKAALLHKKHVIVEKPFVVSLSECKTLMALALENQCMLFEAIPNLFQPALRTIKEAITKLGDLRLVTSHLTQYSSRYAQFLNGQIPNVFSPSMAGGALMDLGVYEIHLMCSLFGKPETVHYFCNQASNGIDLSGIIFLGYPNFQASLVVGKDCRSENFCLLEGDKGYLKVNGSVSVLPEVILNDKTIFTSPLVNPLNEEAKAIGQCLEEKNTDLMKKWWQQTWMVVEILEKARQSANLPF